MNKYDKRRKYYIVLDCETATLPHAINYTDEQRKNIAIAKPLIYDLGWKVMDAKGNPYARKNYLISAVFSVPSIFDTAYYAEKRPLYLEKLEKGEIILADWRSAVRELVEDMDACEAVVLTTLCSTSKRQFRSRICISTNCIRLISTSG